MLTFKRHGEPPLAPSLSLNGKGIIRDERRAMVGASIRGERRFALTAGADKGDGRPLMLNGGGMKSKMTPEMTHKERRGSTSYLLDGLGRCAGLGRKANVTPVSSHIETRHADPLGHDAIPRPSNPG
jgi:hypothetical protein